MNRSECRPPLRDYAHARSTLFAAATVARKAADREADAIKSRLRAIEQLVNELTRLERLAERRGPGPDSSTLS